MIAELFHHSLLESIFKMFFAKLILNLDVELFHCLFAFLSNLVSRFAALVALAVGAGNEKGSTKEHYSKNSRNLLHDVSILSKIVMTHYTLYVENCQYIFL